MEIKLDIGRDDIIKREKDKVCPELIKGLEHDIKLNRCVCSLLKDELIRELSNKGAFKDSFEKDRFRESLKCD